jgi:copper(I)-binding protein
MAGRLSAMLAVLALACGPGLAIEDPYLPAPAGDVAALYFVAVDREGGGDRLLGASSDAADDVALHRTVEEGGALRMQPAPEGLAVPPGGVLRLEPGGAHVMLSRLSTPLVKGDTIVVRLRFERAGVVEVEVPVVSYADVEHHHR